MIASRRSFLAGIGAIIAAPAIVRADSLMRVRGIIIPTRKMTDSFLWADIGVHDLSDLIYRIKPTETPLLTGMSLATWS